MQFDSDWRDAGKRALDGGVWFVNVGSDKENSKIAVQQAKEIGDGCFATVGIHPTEGDIDDFAEIAKFAEDEKMVAIGECGMELTQNSSAKILPSKNLGRQEELFRKHIELAIEVEKPVMAHCRNAYQEAWEILNEYKKTAGDKFQFDMHFFTGNWETAKKFLDLGGYLSFPGVITFTSDYNEVIRNTPLDRIMSETDAPFATPKPSAEYLAKAGFAAPIPHRGQRNEPAYVKFVAERIAELRPEPREEVLAALVNNARRFYNIP